MPRLLGRVFTLFSLLAALLLLAGCSSGESLKAAEAGVAHFRALTAAKQFDAIYAEASDEFKQATTAADLGKLLTMFDQKLGPLKSTEPNGWRVNHTPTTTTVYYGLKSQFERGAGTETFVFFIRDGKAVLGGYNIQSNALLMN
ncbi:MULTISPECIES: hypothetical protein [Rhodomicrobium]|uniref:hypothetical protein n=1 Tax=Rhodomicrobium TaxID=1068 RepID=UPI000F74A8C6|nr:MULTISPECIES: hypothetical protein [Rhodomicrobium]